MSTGRAPFRAETNYGILRRVTDEEPRAIGELSSDIPNWLSGLVGKLLAKNAADRFRDSSHVAALLEECVAHVQQPGVKRLPEAVKVLALESKKSLKSWIIGLVLVSLLAVGWKFWLPGDGGNNSLGSSEVQGESVGGTSESSLENDQSKASQPPTVDDRWASEVDLELEQLDAEFEALLESLDDQNF